MTTSVCCPSRRTARTAKPSVPVGAYAAAVSTRSKHQAEAKAYVKWLWVERTDFQEDFALSYGFHIPARLSLAKKAAKLREGAAADVVTYATEHGYAQPLLWTPTLQTAYQDALSRIIKDGASPDERAEVRGPQDQRRTPAGEEALTPMRRPTTRRPRRLSDTTLWFWIFVGPFAAGLALFTYVPLLWSVYLSFFDAHNTVSPTDFVGFGQLHGDAARRRLHLQPGHLRGVLAVHRARRRTRSRSVSR